MECKYQLVIRVIHYIDDLIALMFSFHRWTPILDQSLAILMPTE